MAVTAIVMALIFVVFSIVSERLIDYKNQNQFVADMNRLTYSVNKDIFESQKMEASEDGIVFKDYSGNIVNYNFSDEKVLRSNAVFTDTFKIKINRVILDSAKSESKKLVFCKLTLQTEINESKLDLQFFKRVYPNELLQSMTP